MVWLGVAVGFLVHEKAGALVGARRRPVERMVDTVEQCRIAAHCAEHDGRHVVGAADKRRMSDSRHTYGQGHASKGCVFVFSSSRNRYLRTYNHQLGFLCGAVCSY